MPFLIGTDEAGYGPNLGPLVITATCWQLPDGLSPDDLWTVLADAVTQKRVRGDKRLHIADSKQVYSSGKSLQQLERGVLSCLGLLDGPEGRAESQRQSRSESQRESQRESHPDCVPDSVPKLGRLLSGDAFTADYCEATGRADEHATAGADSLPVATTTDELQDDVRQLRRVLDAAGVRFRGARSAVLFAPEFNRRVAEHDSKGIVLSGETLRLIRESVDELGEVSPVGQVVCDKHGGRNRYDDLIADAFDGALVFRGLESGPRSEYRLGNMEFCFRTKAEEILPVAVASMISKYVREVVMRQFNAYWQSQVPGLKPTKGYPVDAARFWDDIADVCETMGVARSSLWRCR